MRHTYAMRHPAYFAGGIITVPDQVAAEQREYADANRSFWAIRANGNRVRVRLNGSAYGLYTSGTGDIICKSA